LLDELLQGLREAESLPAARKLVVDLEDFLTPAQIQAALPVLDTLEGPAHISINRSYSVILLRRETAEPYVQQAIVPGVKLYRGREDPEGRALVVVLSGRHPRPMVAISVFLQHLPAELFDVLLVYDETNSHYTAGVEGYATDLLSLTRRVHAEFASRGYARVYHYGVSSGGFPALRMGLMAPAHRSIAIGGLFQWPIDRLLSGAKVTAFDPICACHKGEGANLVCVHSEMKRDIGHAQRVIAAVKARGVRVRGVEEHNLLHPLFVAEKLRGFNQRLFGFQQGRAGARFVDGFGF